MKVSPCLTHSIYIDFHVLLLLSCMSILYFLVYAIYIFAIQKLDFEKSHNQSKIIELILILNLFYAAFGVFTSILVWTNKYSSLLEFDSIVGLLGHVTCSVLVPAMVIPVMERMREDAISDSPTQPVAESGNDTMESGSQESREISGVPSEGHNQQSVESNISAL